MCPFSKFMTTCSLNNLEQLANATYLCTKKHPRTSSEEGQQLERGPAESRPQLTKAGEGRGEGNFSDHPFWGWTDWKRAHVCRSLEATA